MYDQKYESGGAFWPHLHTRIIACLVIQQISLMGLLGTQSAKISTPVLLLLPVLTIAFHIYCKNRFEPAFSRYPLEVSMISPFSSFVYHCCDGFFSSRIFCFKTFASSLQEAMAKDTLDRTMEPDLDLRSYLQDSYMHPVFKMEEDEEIRSGWTEEPPLVPTKCASRGNTPAASVNSEV